MDTDPTEQWPALLAEAMETGGFTPRTLARAIDVSDSAVYYWLNGRSAPRPIFQARMAKALGVPAHDLFPLEQVA